MKQRLIIDFDGENEEELKEFYKTNFINLKELKFSPEQSDNEIKTYYTEFEKDVRRGINEKRGE